jgi:hypothetical protein
LWRWLCHGVPQAVRPGRVCRPLQSRPLPTHSQNLPFCLPFATHPYPRARLCVCSHAAPLSGNLAATFFIDQPLVYPYVPDYHAAMLVGSGTCGTTCPPLAFFETCPTPW